MRARFSVDIMRGMEKAPPFAFTKGCPVMRLPVRTRPGMPNWILELPTRLYDLENDYAQQKPMHDPDLEAQMIRLCVELMAAADAPVEQYQRLGLPRPDDLNAESARRAVVGKRDG